MDQSHQPRRNAPVRYLPGGWPAKSSNRFLMLGQQVERLANGLPVGFHQLDVSLKRAAEETPRDGLRRRAEVLCWDGDRLLCIRKPGYLLLPGGGFDEGETAENAAIRETLEEAGARLSHLRTVATISSVCPGHPMAKGAEGCDTHLMEADWAGEWPGSHPDREDFGWLPGRDALNYLAKCLIDVDNAPFLSLNSRKIEAISAHLAEKKVAAWKAPEGSQNGTIESLLGGHSVDGQGEGLLIDLDGTVRDWDEAGEYVDPEAIRILPNTLEVLRAVREIGLPIIAVTNHTNYESHELTPEALRECQERTSHELGGLLDDIFWASQADPKLLKPEPAMLLEACRQHGLDPQKCLYVGDKPMDQEAAKAAGMGFCWADEFFGRSVGADKESQEAKVADVAVYQPRQELWNFDPQGNVLVRPQGRRRYDLPLGPGERIPYTYPLRFAPPEGAPEAGVHGYEYGFGTAEAPALEGYEAREPQEVLKDLYASMGLRENRGYQSLDRARAQSLVRALRRRQSQQRPPVVPSPGLPVETPVLPVTPAPLPPSIP